MARSLNDYFITVNIADITVAGTYYVPIPDRSRCIKAISTIDAAITVADETLTLQNNAGTAMGTGVITVTQVGSAAGDVDTAEPSSNNSFEEGEALRIVGGNASTGPARGTVVLIMRR